MNEESGNRNTSSADDGNVVFSRNEERRRFEAVLDGHVAYSDYHQHEDRLTFLHTEVPQELEGRGVGSALVKWALEYARAERLTVMPICPFVISYIGRHREYVDLVGENLRYLVR